MKTLMHLWLILGMTFSLQSPADAQFRLAKPRKSTNATQKCLNTMAFPQSGKVVASGYTSLTQNQVKAYYLNGKYYIKAMQDFPPDKRLRAIFYVNPLAGYGAVKSLQLSYTMNLLNPNNWRYSYLNGLLLKTYDGGLTTKINDRAKYYKSNGTRTLTLYPHAGPFKTTKTIMLDINLVMKKGDTFIIDKAKLNLECN